jgi:cell division septation protein DedD
MGWSDRRETPPRQSKPEEEQRPKTQRRVRIEMGPGQLLLSCVVLFLALGWMFVFGILVGRGVPLADPGEVSLRARLLSFIGLARETPPPPKDVADAWEDPKKMLQSLEYYQSLAKKTEPIPVRPQASAAKPATPDKDRPSSESKTKPATPTPTSPSTSEKPAASAATPDKTTPPPPEKTAATARPPEKTVEKEPPPTGVERYTLLAASLKDQENAKRYVDQLRSKGYPSRLETIEMAGSGRWNRVLVGAFESRDEALRFAAEFNRKEGLQGLVIRDGH